MTPPKYAAGDDMDRIHRHRKNRVPNVPWMLLFLVLLLLATQVCISNTSTLAMRLSNPQLHVNRTSGIATISAEFYAEKSMKNCSSTLHFYDEEGICIYKTSQVIGNLERNSKTTIVFSVDLEDIPSEAQTFLIRIYGRSLPW